MKYNEDILYLPHQENGKLTYHYLFSNFKLKSQWQDGKMRLNIKRFHYILCVFK